MRVTGTVYSEKNTNRPIANAQIEVWYCDNDGIYYLMGNGGISTKIALRSLVIK